ESSSRDARAAAAGPADSARGRRARPSRTRALLDRSHLRPAPRSQHTTRTGRLPSTPLVPAVLFPAARQDSCADHRGDRLRHSRCVVLHALSAWRTRQSSNFCQRSVNPPRNAVDTSAARPVRFPGSDRCISIRVERTQCPVRWTRRGPRDAASASADRSHRWRSPSSCSRRSPRLTQTRSKAGAADSTHAETPSGRPSHDSARAAEDSIRISEIAARPPVVTHHTMQLGGASLAYTATTGMLPIRNDTTGVAEGYIFYVAYTKDGAGDPAKRPITFVFNGGPGSSTVWLHLGAFGPRRVKLNADGSPPAPPPTLEDNPYTLLDQSDLVFLDPVGTGYSRPSKPALGPNFWGVTEDLRSVAEFIRLYLTRYERWLSPKFLAGESYGTTRAAGLSGVLADRGIALNGIVLISTVLNFETLSDQKGNDLGFVGFLPSYTAIAWYHKKLPPDLHQQTVEQVTAQAEQFAGNGYTLALDRGASLTAAQRKTVIDTLSRFTGLSPAFIDNNDLRIPLDRFDQELLRGQHQTVGRLDGRFTAYATDAGAERGAFDPSDAN